MARRRSDDTSFLDDAFELFAITPVWVGPVVALILFSVFRYVLPTFFPPKADGIDVGIVLRQFFPMIAWIVAAAVLLAWVAAEVHKLFNRRLLDQQGGAETIRNLSWREFESLVCEAFRRKGYLAETVGAASADGGVDVELRGHGEHVLVQCKQWRAYTVGVKPVRELLGVVTSRRATRGILVCSGTFTREATRFAAACRQIELIDGRELGELVQSVQTNPASKAAMTPHTPARQSPTPMPASATQSTAGPRCPLCGAGMVRRLAKRGGNAGTEFWGCSGYPNCRGTRPT